MTNGSVTSMTETDERAFSRVGGIWLGSWSASSPYATLSGYKNALRLSTFGQDYVFLKSNITALGKFRFVLNVGLLIKHTVPLYPESIVFWVSALPFSSRFALLKEQLNALGYEVQD
jgi:hypothetical protein